jgi:diguanylate cyclase (GGDEF)-like protein/putative nucleotidyltransferase with HDIG domain
MSSDYELVDLVETSKNVKTEIDYGEFLNTILNASNRLLDVSDFKAAIFNSIEILDQSFIFYNINVYVFDDNYLTVTKLVGSNTKEISNLFNYSNKLINDVYFSLKTHQQLVYCNDKHCTLILPLHFQNEVIGFVEFAYDNKYSLSMNLITLLKIFVNSLSEVIIRHKREKEAESLSYFDTLTSLHNRRSLEKEVNRIIASNDYLPLTIIVADVNGLKLVNDSFGHSQGDEIIKIGANLIKEEIKPTAILCRWGGDEFVIILPKTDELEAKLFMARINEKASKTTLNFIPISIALATSTTHHPIKDISKLFNQAEDAMYKIKNVDSPMVKREIIYSIMNALCSRSSFEETHSKRVSQLCSQIALALGYPEQSVQFMKTLGLYHDIGKIAVKESTLNKVGKLTDDEFNELKRHCEVGYRILSSVGEMAELADYVLKHHERLDGKGYPYGLTDEEIPQISKILAVAESYDAMVSKNSYRHTDDVEAVINELIKNSGTQFDPQIVRTLVERVLKKPWYSVIYGANNTFVALNDKFNPLENVVIIDPTDPTLSVNDIKIEGNVNTSVPGTYHLIYTIFNNHGKSERITRKVSVGKMNKLDVTVNDQLRKIAIDGASFDYKFDENNIKIDVIGGGGNNWSCQLIYPNITLHRGKKYLVKFTASSSVPKKEVHISVGWMDEENFFWHSFLNNTDNKFFLETFSQNYTLIFSMEAETFHKSDLKIEFGTGENFHIDLTNIGIYEVDF